MRNSLESCPHSLHSWGSSMYWCYWVRWPTLNGRFIKHSFLIRGGATLCPQISLILSWNGFNKTLKDSLNSGPWQTSQVTADFFDCTCKKKKKKIAKINLIQDVLKTSLNILHNYKFPFLNLKVCCMNHMPFKYPFVCSV